MNDVIIIYSNPKFLDLPGEVWQWLYPNLDNLANIISITIIHYNLK